MKDSETDVNTKIPKVELSYYHPLDYFGLSETKTISAAKLFIKVKHCAHILIEKNQKNLHFDKYIKEKKKKNVLHLNWVYLN